MLIRQLDVLIATVLVAVGFVQLVSDPGGHVQLAALLTLAMTMPLLARRLWTLRVTIAVAGAVAAYCVVVDPTPPFAGFLALLVLSYTLMREGGRWIWVGYVAIVAAVAVTGVMQPTAALDWLYPLVYLGGAAVVGTFVRRRSGQQDLETTSQIRQAVGEERTRIARELHDVVAHGLGVMVLHAEAADEVLDRQPETARASLARIQETGRESIGELKLLLGLLRSSDEPDQRSPQPGLAQLPALIAELDSTSCDIDFSTSGDLANLPTGIQLTIYRVVQEALTNTLRHSQAKSVDITVVRDTEGVEVSIRDVGPARTGSSGAGHGLLGMRERAHLYGGSLEAGPVGEGFCVNWAVPLP